MSEPDRQAAEEEAKVLRQRAARQAKQSAKNTARAAKVGAEPALHHAAERIEHVAEEVEDTAKRVNPWAVAAVSSDTGQGFIALAVSIWAGTISVNKFRSAWAARKGVVS